jgi:ribosomal peptide maturation radical SAM protein 1
MSSPRVLIAEMPFLPLERPALGPAILKRGLNERGMACDLKLFHYRFADLIGVDLYQRFANGTPTHDLAGDWVFTRALYGEGARPAEDFERYARGSAPQYYDPGFFLQVEYCRETAERFVAECLAAVPVGRYDIIGFSSTFQQNIASLALAKRLKQREPGVIIVFGGSNCEDEMGAELHRGFPFVDYVCSGESDETFPRLVRAIREGADPADIGGVTFRRDGVSRRSPVPQKPVSDMDSLPAPDHSDFVASFRRSTASLSMRPQLTMETSRGCWWGQKHHCTFCGLNGLSMSYRSKSVERAYREIRALIDEYGINSFFNTDNILDLDYFNTLFPMLERDGVRVELYYEMKANLKRSQLLALKRTGTNWFQPGLESLSTHVLQLMQKGVSAIQNVQVLKWARELRMSVTWNVICGFPGELPEDYRGMARMVPLISHLQPPASFSRFRADRFSPVFNEPARFGLTLQPYESYNLCYPEHVDLSKVAYFFTHDAPRPRETLEAIGEAWSATEEWRKNAASYTFTAVDGGEFLVLVDRRLGREPKMHLLAGERRTVYRVLESAMTEHALLSVLAKEHPARAWDAGQVREILAEFEQTGLTLLQDGMHLALAVVPADEELEGRATSGVLPAAVSLAAPKELVVRPA